MIDSVQPIYLDEFLLVLNKPAGLLAVPGRGPDKQDAFSVRAQQRWPDALVVHRLDMATSGLLLMARGALAQRALSMAFAARAVFKRYEAVVYGRPLPTAKAALNDPASDPSSDWSEIDLPLILDWPQRPRSIVNHSIGKPSLTRWRLLAYDAQQDTSRLALEPVTGRSHQLRVHLQAIGHPILGDALYGPPPTASPGRSEASEVSEASAPRLLLHACVIRFIHPMTGEAMAFESPVPF